MANLQPKPRLLLTGASGFLGYNIYHQAKNNYQILGVVHKHPYSLPGMQQLQLDITDRAALRNIVRESSPDAIIHTAAISNINTCQQHPADTAILNVNTAIYLAQLASELQVPFVFTSTDLVFDGKKGDYTEQDAVSPINIYGEQKVKAEEGIREVYPDAAICRMPLMYGIGGPGAKNFFLPMLQQIKDGIEVGLFTDEFRSSLGATSAARGLVLAAASFKGIYHLGGPEKLSRYQLGQLMASEAKVEKPNIKAVKQADIPMAAPRPQNVTFDSGKANARGFNPLSNQAEIRQLLAAL